MLNSGVQIVITSLSECCLIGRVRHIIFLSLALRFVVISTCFRVRIVVVRLIFRLLIIVASTILLVIISTVSAVPATVATSSTATVVVKSTSSAAPAASPTSTSVIVRRLQPTAGIAIRTLLPYLRIVESNMLLALGLGNTGTYSNHRLHAALEICVYHFHHVLFRVGQRVVVDANKTAVRFFFDLFYRGSFLSDYCATGVLWHQQPDVQFS